MQQQVLEGLFSNVLLGATRGQPQRSLLGFADASERLLQLLILLPEESERRMHEQSQSTSEIIRRTLLSL